MISLLAAATIVCTPVLGLSPHFNLPTDVQRCVLPEGAVCYIFQSVKDGAGGPAVWCLHDNTPQPQRPQWPGRYHG